MARYMNRSCLFRVLIVSFVSPLFDAWHSGDGRVGGFSFACLDGGDSMVAREMDGLIRA
jgi:hypothetical protein